MSESTFRFQFVSLLCRAPGGFSVGCKCRWRASRRFCSRAEISVEQAIRSIARNRRAGVSLALQSHCCRTVPRSLYASTSNWRPASLGVVMGFPPQPCEGSEPSQGSLWSAAEQQALADFLHAAAGTRARFLLTSRRDERGWLGELPQRVTLPPMPMQERVQLARALAEKCGRPRGSPLRLNRMARERAWAGVFDIC